MLQLLQYHVVPGMAVTVSSLTDGQTLPTALTGQSLKVSILTAATVHNWYGALKSSPAKLSGWDFSFGDFHQPQLWQPPADVF